MNSKQEALLLQGDIATLDCVDPWAIICNIDTIMERALLYRTPLEVKRILYKLIDLNFDHDINPYEVYIKLCDRFQSAVQVDIKVLKAIMNANSLYFEIEAAIQPFESL